MSDIERYGVIALTVLGLLFLGILLKDEMPWADDPADALESAEVAAGRKVSKQPIMIPRSSNQPAAKRSARPLAPISTPAPKTEAPRVSTPRRSETNTSGAALAQHRVSELAGLKGGFRVDEPPIVYPGPNAAEPKPAATPVVDGGAPRMHEIVSGDTLGKIAKRYLGSEGDWETLVEWNPGLDPHRLKIGRKIVVSRRLGEAAPPAEEPQVDDAPTGSRPGTYEVQPGDTLSGIASKVMGSIKFTDELYQANRDILPSKNALKVGQVLKIP